MKDFKTFLVENSDFEYKNWKRKNITLRGMKNVGEENNISGSLGRGLYTAPLSNKSMAKQYGDVYFVLNAIPKKPKIVNTLNDAEIWIQKLINDFCKKHSKEYRRDFFENNTNIESEMLKLGFDGLIIKGREMVNYKPENVKYFKTEEELYDYFNYMKGQK
jgi:hypothetical protein